MSKSINVQQVEPLGSDNYQRWKLQITLLLKTAEVWDIVNGATARPTVQEEITAWEKRDIQAQAIIVPTLGKNQTSHIYNCTTSREIFDRLKELNSDASSLNKQHTLSSFLNYKISADQSVITAYMEVEELARSLNEMGVQIADSMLVTKIVSCLPEGKYHAFKKAWDSVSDDRQTMAMLLSRLRKEDLEELQLDKESKSSGRKTAAYFSNAQSGSKSGNLIEKKGRNIDDLKKQTSCHNCGKRGHWKAECRVPNSSKFRSEQSEFGQAQRRDQHGFSRYNQNKQQRDRSGQYNSSFRQHQHQSSNPTPQSSNQSPHSTRDIEKSAHAFMFNGHNSLDSKTVWISDSGATHHVSGCLEWFEDYRPFLNSRSVSLTDRSKAKALGTGTIRLQAWFHDCWEDCNLINVLYIPGAANLFSEIVLAQKGYEIFRNKNGTTFHKEGIVGPEADYRDGMYIMKFRAMNPQAFYTVDNKAKLWHERFAHVNMEYIKATVEKNAVIGLNPKEIEDKFTCDSCHLGKETRKPFPTIKRLNTNYLVGEKLHADLAGKMPQKSVGGSNYFLLIKDEVSSFRMAYFLKTKDQASKCIQDFIHMVQNQTGNYVKSLKTDNGSEFVNQDLGNFLAEAGIVHQTSAAYCPESNGRIERDMRTIKDTARAMMQESSCPESLWAEAVATSVYIHNRLVNKQTPHITPFEAIFKKKPNVAHLRKFGCTAFMQIPKEKRHVWDAKAKKMTLVGYDSQSQKYRLYNKETKEIIISRNASFVEEHGVIPPSFEICEDEQKECNGSSDENKEVGDSEDDSPSDTETIVPDNADNANQGTSRYQVGINGSSYSVPEDLKIIIRTKDGEYEAEVPANRKSSVKLKKGQKQSKVQVKDHNLRDRFGLRPPKWYQANLAITIDEPQSYQEALSSPHSIEWNQAIKAELQSHDMNGTWELVERPKEVKPLDSRWVFKVKRHPDGSLDRFKARLVVRGFRQRYGMDYSETFSPVCRYESIRLVLAIAISKNYIIKQFDITTAFLYGSLEETIFMNPPEGLQVQKDIVCLLKKSLYGLKQSPRCWIATFSKFLAELNFSPSTSDTSVYLGSVMGFAVILILYVDDGLVCAQEEAPVIFVLESIQKRFGVKIGKPTSFVGIELIQDEETGNLILRQESLIRKLFQDFCMNDCKTSAIPLHPSHVFKITKDSETIYPYRQLIGTLLFLSRCTRPDISYAVSKLSQFCSNFNVTHWNAAKGVIRYIKETATLGLEFKKESPLNLVGFTDSDYAGDTVDRKSTTGVAFFLGTSIISWYSQKQTVVAVSSTEAEYVALAAGAKEGIWLRNFLQELANAPEGPTPIFVDNQSSIRLAYNPEHHSRSKHIDVKFHFTRSLVQSGKLKIAYIPTASQVADIFTKPLGKSKFREMRSYLGMKGTEELADEDMGQTRVKSPKRATRFLTSMTMLMFMFLIIGDGLGFSFQTTQPVLWRGTNTPITRGSYRVLLTVKFVSPCTIITSDRIHKDLQAEVQDACEELYKDMFLNELVQMCPSQDKRTLIMRNKRFIISALILGLIISSVVVSVGIGVAGIAVAVTNTNSINQINQIISEQTKNAEALAKRVDFLENAVSNIHIDLQKIVKQLEDHENDFLELKTKSVSSMFSISYVTTRLMLARQIIRETTRLWNDRKINPTFLDYFNFTLPCKQDCPIALATPRRCHFTDDWEDLYLDFDVPLVNSSIQLVEADPFELMLKQDNQTCKIIYMGPRNSIISKEGKCTMAINIKPLAGHDMILFPSDGCLPDTKLPSESKYFTIERCDPSHTHDEVDYVQVKPHFGSNYIYCSGGVLEIDGKTHPCPEDVFVLPISASFKINNIEYVGSQVHLNHQEMIDPLFTMRTNWHLQPRVNLSSLISNSQYALKNKEEIPETVPTVHILAWVVGTLGVVIILLLIVLLYLFIRDKKIQVSVLVPSDGRQNKNENIEMSELTGTRA